MVVSKIREKENRQLLHQAETLKHKNMCENKTGQKVRTAGAAPIGLDLVVSLGIRPIGPIPQPKQLSPPKNHSSGRTARLSDRAKRIWVTEL